MSCDDPLARFEMKRAPSFPGASQRFHAGMRTAPLSVCQRGFDFETVQGEFAAQ